MQLVEQHVIDQKDSRYGAIDAAAFASKNLYGMRKRIVREEDNCFKHDRKNTRRENVREKGGAHR
jgi:hypothetical protein